jgi:NAD(P)-dependent dehydrogenase (short-subunit alcohol dehydrogenase family)
VGQLDGKTIVITGAGRGLGRAFAEGCCAAGARVVIGELRTDLAEATAADLAGRGFDVMALPLDVGDPESVASFAETVRSRVGRIDGLVNNAAIATGIGGKTYDEIDVETFDLVLRVNVRGLWLVVKAMVPLMERGGIVNLASDTALWGAPRLLHYVASKGAVISMTRSLARELGPKGIWVNALAVGLTRVEATEYVPRERHELYETGRSLQRPQYPEDVVGSAVFLLSDAAAFVTGQVLPVNGGFVFN